MPPKLIVIAGPTCSGKTAVAIQLAQLLGTAIISADSRQCYREMTIGTAKPTTEELHAAKHYFIDAFPVTQPLTAADYEKLALGYLDEIYREHSTAIVCGGTGLYLKALCEGLDPMPPVNESIDKAVNEQYAVNGITWLQEAIRLEDPAYYDTGEIQNPARLIRALAFVRSNGISIRKFQTREVKKRDFEVHKFAIHLPREVLYERINHRVDQMMLNGLLEEVEHLYPLRQLKNLQTVGYAELFQYLDGQCSLAEAIDKIKQHTRNYAKRQITWFSKDKDFHWLSGSNESIIHHIMAEMKHTL